MRSVFLGSTLAAVLVLSAASAQANLMTNGDFSDGLNGWSVWVERDDFAGGSGEFQIDVPAAGDVRLRGWSYNGGVYQVVPVPIGVPLTIDGTWHTTASTTANALWGEVIVLDGNLPPVNGVDVPGPVIYKNDTWTLTTGWGFGTHVPISSSAVVVNDPTGGPLGVGSATGFVTVILKAGSVHAGVNANKVVRYDNIVLTPEPTSLVLLAVGGLALIGRRRRA